MGAFNINITGVGGHGCERKAKPGEKLFGRCGRFTCPDCAAYDFVQRLKQAGMLQRGGHGDQRRGESRGTHGEALPAGRASTSRYRPGRARSASSTATGRRTGRFRTQALFTHWPGSPTQVVDDMLKNERRSGQF
jgi:hypothetical protein